MSTFPQFTKLQLSDKDRIEHIVARFAPYSDFNFTSLYCWNVDETAEFSIVSGDTLVIKIPDYLTGEPVYSLIGGRMLDSTIYDVVTVVDNLRLVPESAIASLADPKKFVITEDRDQFDYVYNLSDLTALSGKKFSTIRNKVNQFSHAHPNYHFSIIDSISDRERQQMKNIFTKWAEEKESSNDEIRMEREAIDRFITGMVLDRMVAIIMYIDDDPVGFSINEITRTGEYAICHWQKTLHAYTNCDSVLTLYSSNILLERGCRLVNWEQDLGISGLRQLKQSYRPVEFLKKYSIKLA